MTPLLAFSRCLLGCLLLAYQLLIPFPFRRRRRPHILKIDVEGHDYEVLMSFLRPDTPLNQLPLLIEFEAKSIAHNYDKAQARMEAL